MISNKTLGIVVSALFVAVSIPHTKAIDSHTSTINQLVNDAVRQESKLKTLDLITKPSIEALSYQKPPEAPPNISEDKIGLMTQAGIDPNDFSAVDYIVSNEGGWNGVTRWNTSGSGAYGLCQALPANKMSTHGADYMTNPVTQLKWCNDYIKGYGGWHGAVEFKKCTGWCFSSRTKTKVYKDHTWF